ncbi:hypothetical protein BH23CYA1_BH23CYA1_03570 [soil metagenome]
MYFLFDISLDLTWQDFAALWAETERQYAPVTSIDHFLCRSLGDSYLAFYNSRLGHRRRQPNLSCECYSNQANFKSRQAIASWADKSNGINYHWYRLPVYLRRQRVLVPVSGLF